LVDGEAFDEEVMKRGESAESIFTFGATSTS